MSRAATTLSVTVLILLSSLSAQQAPPRDAPPSGNAIVRGRVTDAQGLPLPRTHITLTAGRNRYRAMTNPDGAYELSGIASGSYRLTAERTGYLDAEYGAAPVSPADTKSPGLTLAADDVREHADFTLLFGGVIDGRVIDENGEPLPAQVEAIAVATALRYPGRRPTSPTQTNDLGRFRISGLAPGTYLVSVAALRPTQTGAVDHSSSAYAVTYYPGVLEPERATPIAVAAAQHVEGVEFATVTVPSSSSRALPATPISRTPADDAVTNGRVAAPPAAALVGRITDGSGRPVPDLVITALEARFVEGRPVRAATISVTPRPVTDPLGEFRISGLPPGRYYVMASSKEVWPSSRRNETLAFNTTFYPGVPYDGAQAVDVGAREEAALNFTIVEGPVGHVAGRLLKTSGEPHRGAELILQRAIRGIRPLGNFLGQNSTAGFAGESDVMSAIRTSADGTFRFADIPSGDYLLSTPDTLISEFVTVDSVGLDGVTLVENGVGGAIDGTIVMDDGGRPPFVTRDIKPVAFTPTNELSPVVHAATRLDPNWHFFVGDLHAPVILRLLGVPAEYAIAAVTRTNEDVTDRAITVTGDIDDVRIVLTRKTGEVSGRVETGRGDPVSNAIVVAFAENAATWGVGSRYVRTVNTDERGRFTVKGLLPGSYRVAAPRTLLPGEWQNPDYLARASRTATRVTAAAGSSVTDVRITQAP
jgi:protocatechuate 3,4-dioxygenase beta subunit